MVYELYLYNLVETCPNMCAWSFREMGRYVDEYGPEVMDYKYYDTHHSYMLEYMFSLDPEKLRDIMENGEFRLRYIYRGGENPEEFIRNFY